MPPVIYSTTRWAARATAIFVAAIFVAFVVGEPSGPLSVMYQHVVPIQTGTGDGWSTAEASMRTVPVVVMEPARKMRGAFL